MDPWLCLDKHELTDDEKKTQEYDRLAFKLVGYAAAPLMAGYTYYSRTCSLNVPGTTR